MTDRLIVVAGASSGIGREIAIACTERGNWTVVAVARRAGRLEQLQKELGSQIVALPLDLARAGSRDVLRSAIEDHGGSVNLVVNSVGTIKPLGLIAELQSRELEDTFAANVSSALNLLNAVELDLAPESLIVAIGSAAIEDIRAYSGLGAYLSTKAGFEVIHLVAAVEWLPNSVKVVVVRPGLVRTEMYDALRSPDYVNRDRYLARDTGRRLREPRQVADAVLDLYDVRADLDSGSIIDLKYDHRS